MGDSLKSTEVDLKDISPDCSLEDSSVKTDATIKDSYKESPAVTDYSSSQRSEKVSLTKQKGNDVVELINISPDFLQEGSSMEIDATKNDLSSSQKSAEVNLKMYKRRKTWSTKHNAIVSNINGIVVPKDTFSIETSLPALYIFPLHLVTRNSHAGSNFCPEENEGKEQNMLEKAAESSNAEQELEEVSSRPSSIVARVEHFVEESMPEVLNLNTVQGTIDNSSNPEDNSGYVKNANPKRKLDDYGMSGYSCSVNYKKEPIMEVDNKDDSNKISDEPLTFGLVEKETKALRDQGTLNGGSASEEMMLMEKHSYEQRSVTDVSVTDIPKVQIEEDNGRKQDINQITRHDMSSAGDTADLSLVCKKDDHSKITHVPLGKTITSHSKKKLLVLDVNGLLADFVEHVPWGYEPDTWISSKAVFKRPFCDDFLEFCFDRFYVGVWSSRHKYNVDAAIRFLMGKSASKLLFCWNQYQCTKTDFETVENRDKPLVFKELRKLWEKLEPGLPWEKGEFNESNTLLLDDSPHKALLNPEHTAIFPYSYNFRDRRDSSLGPGGDLRAYLEGLAMAEKVQEYVASNPFGQRAITERNPSWRYYKKVIDSVNAPNDFRTFSSSRWERTAYRGSRF
ncbi:putative FCP1 likey domain-containing protein [Senna tora]|uniref:Putative FCP1 likey domain-containing protein n=1 Tax=Senna tora TaxID=362788 RepID=A0A834SL33_9FABA|nr:putative FCP1 likey domain-containing protein [Senna tora]